jgi:hypothetical protein
MRAASSIRLLIGLGVLNWTWAGGALAGAPLEINRFSIETGVFLLSTDTQLRVDGSLNQPGTEFDAEGQLGFDDVDRFRADLAWRFAKRHAVTGLFFENARGSTRNIDETLTVGDTTYPVDIEVRSRFITRIANLSYEYAFLQRPSYELAASVGIHDVSFRLSLEADGSAGQASLNSEADTGAPLPLLGFRGTWQLAPRWKLNARAQYFALSIDDFDGSIQDYRVDLSCMLTKHFGFGAGYNEFKFNVDLTRPRFTGALDWSYGGPVVFLRGAW